MNGGDGDRAQAADEQPDQPAEKAQHDGLDEELPQDVAALAPTAMRRPISRVRSVTDTIMMFMMPTPPTMSEMVATQTSKSTISRLVDVMALPISVRSRMTKSSLSGPPWM